MNSLQTQHDVQTACAPHLHNAIRKFKAKLDTDRLKITLAPLLDAVFAHVRHHSDQHIDWVQLVTAETKQYIRGPAGIDIYSCETC